MKCPTCHSPNPAGASVCLHCSATLPEPGEGASTPSPSSSKAALLDEAPELERLTEGREALAETGEFMGSQAFADAGAQGEVEALRETALFEDADALSHTQAPEETGAARTPTELSHQPAALAETRSLGSAEAWAEMGALEEEEAFAETGLIEGSEALAETGLFEEQEEALAQTGLLEGPEGSEAFAETGLFEQEEARALAETGLLGESEAFTETGSFAGQEPSQEPPQGQTPRELDIPTEPSAFGDAIGSSEESRVPAPESGKSSAGEEEQPLKGIPTPSSSVPASSVPASILCPSCETANGPEQSFCQGCSLYLPLLGGKFRIQQKLGEGGFGAVYRGLNVQTDFPVAIKVLHQQLLEHRQRGWALRFTQEAEILQNNQHPHIVRTFDHGEAEGLGAYMVMEWLDGQTLSQLRRRQDSGRFSLDATCRIFAQFLEGLEFIHEKGIVHRDIKPDNLMVVQEHGVEVLKILDFGIAHLEDSQFVPSGGAMGTPQFMAPEQIQSADEAIGPATDLYAAGMVLAWLLTGKLPFEGKSLKEIFEKHMREAPPSLGALCPEAHFSPRLEALFAKACEKSPQDRFGSAEDFLQALREAAPEVFERPLDEGIAPYKGLRFFDVEDAPFFFGRELLLEQLMVGLAPSEELKPRFLGVLGASGSGKSSLVRAGILARIQRGAFAGSEAWPIALMRPSSEPLSELVEALGKAEAPDAAEAWLQELRSSPEALHHDTEEALAGLPPTARRVLVVDQFEELFTLCEKGSERRAFLRALHHAATTPGGRTLVLLTLRADFYGHCARYPTLNRLLSRHQVLLAPMSEEELRSAILQPAAQRGYRFEPGLVEVLLHEAGEDAASLPLLQHALLELWQHARAQGSRLLTLRAYEAFGGVQGALQQRADAIYEALEPAKRELCRKIFLRLTQRGKDAADTRRKVPISSLVPAHTDAKEVQQVLEQLSAPSARLVFIEGVGCGEVPGSGEQLGTVEVSHEALIQSWQRLRDWLDDHREALRIQDAVGRASLAWKAASSEQEAQDYLFSGVRLDRAEEWVRRYPEDPNQRELAFVEASLALQESQRAAERARIEKERELLRRTAEEIYQAQQAQARSQQRLSVAFAMALVLFAVLAGVGLYAHRMVQEATRQGQAARAADALAKRAAQEAQQQRRLAARETQKSERAKAQATAAVERQVRLQKQLLQQSLHRSYQTLGYGELREVIGFFRGALTSASVEHRDLALRGLLYLLEQRRNVLHTDLTHPLLDATLAVLGDEKHPKQRCLAASLLVQMAPSLAPRMRMQAAQDAARIAQLAKLRRDPQACVARRSLMAWSLLALPFSVKRWRPLLQQIWSQKREPLSFQKAWLGRLEPRAWETFALHRILAQSQSPLRIELLGVAPRDPKSLHLLRLLRQDKDRGIRAQAILELGRAGELDLSMAASHLRDPNASVRCAVARAAGGLGPRALPFLQLLSKDSNTQVRRAVIDGLSRMGRRAAPVLRGMLKERDELTRGALAGALGKLPVTEALPLLGPLRKDPSPIVRRRVVLALGRLGPKALSSLGPMCLDEDPSVRILVAERLWSSKHEALPFLRRLAKDADRRVRQKTARTLGSIGGARAWAILQTLARDDEATVRVVVAQSVGKQAGRALPLLQRLAKDDDELVRKTVAEVLGRFGARALPLLQKLAKDDEELVRKAVVGSLQKIGPRALPWLKKLLGDPEELVQMAVVGALGRCGERGFAVLRAMPRFKEGYLRVARARALARMGAKASPWIEKLARDPEASVRSQVAPLLVKLGAWSGLQSLARDRQAFVREAVARAVKAHEARGVALLRRLLKDPSGLVRGAALASLSWGPAKPFARARLLSRLLVHREAQLRKLAYQGLFGLARRQPTVGLKLSLTSPHGGLRRALHEAFLDGRRRFVLRQSLSTSAPPQARSAAAYYLAQLCDPAAIAALKADIFAPSGGALRRWGVLAAARLQGAHKAAAALLEQAKKSPHRRLRAWVAFAHSERLLLGSCKSPKASSGRSSPPTRAPPKPATKPYRK